MKKQLIALVLIASNFAYAGIDIGDLIKAAKKIKVNCNASYLVSQSGVFGHETETQVINIKAKNSGEACTLAQGQASHGSGVFGPNSKVLRSCAQGHCGSPEAAPQSKQQLAGG